MRMSQKIEKIYQPIFYYFSLLCYRFYGCFFLGTQDYLSLVIILANNRLITVFTDLIKFIKVLLKRKELDQKLIQFKRKSFVIRYCIFFGFHIQFQDAMKIFSLLNVINGAVL